MYRRNRLFAPDCETTVFTLLWCGITYMHILYRDLHSSTDSNIQPIRLHILEQSSPLQRPVAEGPSLGLLMLIFCLK